MPGGASQPLLGRPAEGLRRPSLDGFDRLLESVVSCSAFSTWFLGRPASPRPVGLALACLSPPLPCYVDPGSCDASQVGWGFR